MSEEPTDSNNPAQRECNHQWVDSVEGPDVVGKHCSECGIEYDYSEDDL